MNSISREDWAEWKKHKVTFEYLTRLQENRELLKEGIAEGHAGDNDQLNRVIGQCQGIKDCIDYAVRQFDVVDESPKEE